MIGAFAMLLEIVTHTSNISNLNSFGIPAYFLGMKRMSYLCFATQANQIRRSEVGTRLSTDPLASPQNQPKSYQTNDYHNDQMLSHYTFCIQIFMC